MGLESPAADTFPNPGLLPPVDPETNLESPWGIFYTGPVDPQELMKGLSAETNAPSFTAILFAGLIFGSIGIGAWIYGKRQSSAAHMILGALLIAYPYFTGNLFLLYGIGIALTCALF